VRSGVYWYLGPAGGLEPQPNSVWRMVKDTEPPRAVKVSAAPVAQCGTSRPSGRPLNLLIVSESGSHGGEHEDGSLLAYRASGLTALRLRRLPS
jgi:hypothetical protein